MSAMQCIFERKISVPVSVGFFFVRTLPLDIFHTLWQKVWRVMHAWGGWCTYMAVPGPPVYLVYKYVKKTQKHVIFDARGRPARLHKFDQQRL